MDQDTGSRPVLPMFRPLFPLLPHRNIRLSIIFECEGIWRIDAPRAETDRLAGRNKRDLRNESIVLSAAAYMDKANGK